MTQVDARGGRVAPPAPPRHAVDRRTRLRRRWRGSWRAAVRLACRDSLRHKSSSLLILVMIGMPVLLVAGSSALLATSEVTPAEAVPVALGTAQAKIEDSGSGPLVQSADGSEQQSSDPSELPASGDHRPGTPWTAAQLASLTGAVVLPVGYPDLVAEQGADLRRLTSLATDDPASSGLAVPVSGRLPRGPQEVAVTATGLGHGLPTSGTAVIRDTTGTPRSVQVVGVARASAADFTPVDVVVDASWIPVAGPSREFLVRRTAPVGWAEVQSWNAQGLLVLSREVLASPPRTARLAQSDDDGLRQAVTVLVCLALVLETTLLAGPAFAVSAVRRRRSLALIASNGADQAQLSRYVAAQGLVLGGCAALLGLLLGTAAGWAAARLLTHDAGGLGRPPLDAYPGLTSLVAVAAVTAALLAASIPARGAARLALAGVLSGQEHRARPTTRAALLGAVVVALGLVAVLVAGLGLQSTPQLYLAGAGGALMVLGVLPCIPTVLGALGAALRRGPVALRMAARDAARSRSRAGSAVAATTVAVAVLTMLTTANTSDDAQQRRDYVPHAVAGHGTVQVVEDVFPGAPDARPTLDQIRRQHPDWRLEPRGHLGSAEFRDGTGTSDVVAAVPPGCTGLAAIADPDGLDRTPATGSCARLGSNLSSTGLQSRPLSALGADLGLTDAQRATLLGGGLLVTDASVLRGPRVRLAIGTFQRPAGDQRRVTRVLELPAGLLTEHQAELLAPSDGSGAGTGLLLSQTADRLDLAPHVDEWEVIDPSGPISRADEKAVNERADAQLQVERGYQSVVRTLVMVLTGVAAALVGVAALISTALAQVEARADLTTMAALGAAGGFRRRLAAAQALLVALTGTVLGTLLGLGPGIAIAVALTTETGYADGVPTSTPHPVVVLPWVGLTLVVVTVPLLAAALAALCVPRAPQLTRRTS